MTGPTAPYSAGDDWKIALRGRVSSLPPDITEKAYQGLILDLARKTGWLAYHTHDSRRSQPGFPDLVLVRECVLYLEIKTERGKVSAEQEVWVAALHCAGAEVRIVRPSDWTWVINRLARRHAV